MHRLLVPLLTALLLPVAATAQPRCTSRVEATAAVSPTLLVRLTAALSSGLSAHPEACPAVRFDLVGAQLVMTVVLEDGRQVARVLPTPDDAAPTLVALTAIPRVAEPPAEPDPPDAPAPPPEPAGPPEPPEAPPGPPQPSPRPLPLAAPAARAWGLRGGLFGTLGRSAGASRLGSGLDLDLVLPRWVFGLRGAVTATPRSGDPAGAATLSARARWRRGPWELDLGPAFGLRGWPDDPAGLAWTAGMESSLARPLGAWGFVFVRVEAAAVFADAPASLRINRWRDLDDDSPRASFAGHLVFGLRANLL